MSAPAKERQDARELQTLALDVALLDTDTAFCHIKFGPALTWRCGTGAGHSHGMLYTGDCAVCPVCERPICPDCRYESKAARGG